MYILGKVLLDKLLSNLYVGVEPFSVCLVSTGWRLRLPGPPDVMLHFVLCGEGIVRGPDDRAHRLGPGWLVVVPKGVMHALESGDEVREERRIDPPPEGAPVPKNLVAGSFENPDLIVDCGLVHVRYGESIGLFDHLGEMLVIDLADSPQVTYSVRGHHSGAIATWAGQRGDEGSPHESVPRASVAAPLQ